MPLALAEQDMPADGNDDNACPSSTTASTTTDGDTTSKGTTAKTELPVDSSSGRPQPNSRGETEERQESVSCQGAEHGTGVLGGIDASDTDESPSSCAVAIGRRRRRTIASRARICGLLVERGARRAWRRAPSERQVALHTKYATLLEDDDGRNLCTFSG